MTNNDFQNISDEEFAEILKYDSDIVNKPQAHYMLGLRYLTGDGVPQNLEKGLLKLKKAAEMKYQEASDYPPLQATGVPAINSKNSHTS